MFIKVSCDQPSEEKYLNVDHIVSIDVADKLWLIKMDNEIEGWLLVEPEEGQRVVNLLMDRGLVLGA